jgi:hypothetical protein
LVHRAHPLPALRVVHFHLYSSICPERFLVLATGARASRARGYQRSQ